METWALVKTNRRVFIINFVISIVLAAGYAADMLKGRSEMQLVLLLIIPIIIQQIICYVIYRRDSASMTFKYFSLAGFFAVYCISIFASNASFTYVIIFPFIILYILYFERKLIAAIGIMTIVANIVKIGIQVIVHGQSSSDNVTQYTVQMAAIVIICVSLYLITGHTIDINNDKLRRILESQKLLEDNADQLYKNINAQVAKSENIIEITDEIKNLSNEMTAIATNFSDTLISGMESVVTLDSESAKVNYSIKKVYSEIEQLSTLAQDITKIVSLIGKIAMNTNILALNASVEAARAGEYSRGFMAVAEEVIKLAAQSEDSAKSISEIIDSLTKKTSKTLEEVDSLRINNKAQNAAINGLKSVFGYIEAKNNSLAEKIRVLNSDLSNLAISNQDIGASTQKIMEIASRSKIL